jgi:glyoxylase-like metal-dependent hydrolase (beta-lactamase superfamily II)
VRPVPELDWIARDLAVWHGFNPDVRCECFSTAILTDQGWVVFDPIPLSQNAWDELLGTAKLQAIALTSGNHQRESLALKNSLNVSIHAPEAAREEVEADVWFNEGDTLSGFSLIDLPGATPGEAAWCDGQRLVLGDSLIHLDQLEFLPDKYCTNPATYRKSIRKLLALDFQSVFFAHGLPLLSNGHVKISALLR